MSICSRLSIVVAPLRCAKGWRCSTWSGSRGAFGGEPSPGLQILWTTGTDLWTGADLALPEELVGTDRSHPRFPTSGCFLATSNGLASGNHPLEAIAHGLFEVVERDAVTLLALQSQQAQAQARIDLETVDDPDCRSLIDRCTHAGVTVAAWDATSDIGLPVVDAVLFDAVADPWRPLPLARGQGCHPSRSIAFLRALTEAAQDRLTLIAGSRDDTAYDAYGDAAARALRDWADCLTNEPTPIRFDSLPDFTNDTVADDVELVLRRLADAGLGQVAVVDLTHPDLGVPVWRTVVPGLEYLGNEPAAYRPGNRGAAALANAGPGSHLP